VASAAPLHFALGHLEGVRPEEDEPSLGDAGLGAPERSERLRATASSSGQPNAPAEMSGKATVSAPSSSATASDRV